MDEPRAERLELAAVVSCTAEFLRAMLGLPDAASVDAVWMDHERPGVLKLRIRGAGWPAKEGDYIHPASPRIAAYFDEEGKLVRRTIDWGFAEVGIDAPLERVQAEKTP